ncbi:MFS transporter [Candidatus Woesearchaeota archaeon]|nr:MAG: MFS transporter [Candidatus Woesearchaeota archaeon]
MKSYKKRVIVIFSLASFLNDLGSDMIFPVWPLFVTTVLGANMVILGLIDGIGKALVSISQVVSGYLSDKYNNKKIFIWTGYLFGTISRIGYSLSPSWQWLIPFKIIDRSGKMRGAPRDAMVANVSNHSDRGKNFGILRTMDNLGAVVGIISSMILLGILGYRKLFFLAAIPSFIGAMLILIFIKEKKTKDIFPGLHFKDFNPNLLKFFILSGVFSLASFSYSFLLIFSNKLGYKATTLPLFYLIYTLVASLSAYLFGAAADKYGRKNLLFISYGLFGIMSLSFIVINSKSFLFIPFILYGLHLGSLEPVQKTFVSELAPKNLRASILGAFKMVVGLLALPASIIAGLLWENVSIRAPFIFSSILSMVAIIILFFVKENNLRS